MGLKDKLKKYNDAHKDDDFQLHFQQMAKENEYIFILDGDDWIESMCFEEMYNCSLETDSDFVVSGNTFDFVNGTSSIRCPQEQICLNVAEVYNNLPYIYQYLRTVWGKLWKSTIFDGVEEIPTSFEFGGYGGDTMENFFFLERVRKFLVIPRTYYHYTVSESSVSRKLEKGRLNADIALFKYVETYLIKHDANTETNRLFLFRVYKNAMLDTMRLIAQSTNSEESKVEMYEYIMSNYLTYEVIYRDLVGDFGSDRVAPVFAEHIFRDDKNISKKYALFKLIFPMHAKYTSEKIYEAVFRNHELRALFYLGNMDELVGKLLRSNNKNLANEDICQFGSRFSKNQLLLQCLKMPHVLSAYKEIVGLVAEEKYEIVQTNILRILEEENVFHREELVEILLNVSALLEDIDTFIYAKVCKLECKVASGEKDLAVLELEDLVEMGITGEIIEHYTRILYQEEKRG